MKEIKKIQIGVVSFVVLLVVADWAVGTWSEKMYYNSKYGIFHRQIYCLQESEDDIMIIGSSRAAHHYVPQMFEDSFGMTCYNAGSDGMCIYYHYAILASRIYRGTAPKLVIYEALASDAEVSNSATFSLDAALDRLAPHYGEVPAIDSLFALNGWKERMKLMSKTYRYNSKLVQTIKCNYIPWPEDRGYEALSGKINLKDGKMDDVPETSNEVVIEERKLEYVQKLVDLCKINDIKLVMCYSPHYNKITSEGLERIKELAHSNGITFLDYGQTEQLQNPVYFKDASHLNDDGAKEFTKILLESIR